MRRFMHSRRRRPDPLPPTLWGWIVRVWKIKQDDVIELAGYDAAMYLRILAFGAAHWERTDPAICVDANLESKTIPGSLRPDWSGVMVPAQVLSSSSL